MRCPRNRDCCCGHFLTCCRRACCSGPEKCRVFTLGNTPHSSHFAYSANSRTSTMNLTHLQVMSSSSKWSFSSFLSHGCPIREVAGISFHTDVPSQIMENGPSFSHQTLPVTPVSYSASNSVTAAGNCEHSPFSVRGVSWSDVTTVPKRKSHRGLDLDLSLNTEVNIWKGWKENGGTK